MSADRCGFAAPGTFGHECGAPAVLVATRKSTETRSGLFYAKRCAQCAAIKGGENAGLSAFKPFVAAEHVNEWLQ